MLEISIIWLVLPNGNIVLQRRDKNTTVSPELLGLFGGHVEPGETSKAAIKRELAEETSLNVSNLDIIFVSSKELPHPNDPSTMRRVHLYKAAIESSDFKVFEGEYSETYSIANLKRRQDLSPSAKYALDYLDR